MENKKRNVFSAVQKGQWLSLTVYKIYGWWTANKSWTSGGGVFT